MIGKKGDIEKLKADLLVRHAGVPVHVNIEEVRKPEIDAADRRLDSQQLVKRIIFRRA